MSFMAPGEENISKDSVVSIYKEKAAFVALARSFVREQAIAEDIFQESLLYILENADKISDGNLRAYFYKVVMNKCLYYLRQSRRREEILDDIQSKTLMQEAIDILSEKVSDEAALSADMRDRIAECRKKLPPLAFDIFIKSRIKGLTHREIAEVLELSPRKVNTEIRKALSVFRAEFKDYLPVLAMLQILTTFV